jgi:hypothetical protein
VRRSIRGQWSALEREEKIKFWPERDRNNSRPGAYEVGVEHGIVSHLANASGQGRDFDEHRLNFMLSVIKGIEPRNQLEAMLAAQMAAVHMASMTFAGRLAEVETIPQQDSAERAFNKLMRCRWRHSTVTGVAPSKRSHCNMFQSPRAAR